MTRVKRGGKIEEVKTGYETGLDEFILFDHDRNEIRMELPFDILVNPKTNKALGEKI